MSLIKPEMSRRSSAAARLWDTIVRTGFALVVPDDRLDEAT